MQGFEETHNENEAPAEHPTSANAPGDLPTGRQSKVQPLILPGIDKDLLPETKLVSIARFNSSFACHSPPPSGPFKSSINCFTIRLALHQGLLLAVQGEIPTRLFHLACLTEPALIYTFSPTSGLVNDHAKQCMRIRADTGAVSSCKLLTMVTQGKSCASC